MLFNIFYNMRRLRGPDNAPSEAQLKSTVIPSRELATARRAVIDQLVGTTLAERYRLIEKIGEGGMGRVYLAEDKRLSKQVVVKILPDYFAGRNEVVQRFIQEAKMASQIGHENIVDVTDLDKTSNGVPFYVMEYLKGYDLANVLNKEGHLRWDERMKEMLVQICNALGAAHERGIVHRDMKPENIFLVERRDRKEFVKIVDFGVAKLLAAEEKGSESADPAKVRGDLKLTRDGMVVGTVFYMAPEQALGKEVDHRIDIYAVGVMMYELLTGHLPFDIPNEGKKKSGAAFKIMEMHVKEPVIAPRIRRPELNIPEEVEAIVIKALQKDPAARFESMKAMEAAIFECHAPKHIPRASMTLDETEPTARSLEGLLRIKRNVAARKRSKIRKGIIAGVLLAAAAAAVVAGSSFNCADSAPGSSSTTETKHSAPATNGE